MISLSVDLALTDSYLLDFMTVTRRQEVVNNNGLSTLITTTFANQPAVIYPAGSNSLKRWPDMQIQSKTIEIFTRFRLFGSNGNLADQTADFQADVIQWQGNNFLVMNVNDFGRYPTRGWTNALASLLDQRPVAGSGAGGF